MNAVNQSHDLLNSLKSSSKKSSEGGPWQSVMNAAAAAREYANPHDLNLAKSDGQTPKMAFHDAMNQLVARSTKSDAAPTAEDVKLRKTAETLVNKMFVGTMLKSMRASPFKDETMSGGKAGEAYAGLFDQNLAEHAGGGIGTKLVDTLVKQFKKHQGNPNQLHADAKLDVKPTAAAAAVQAAGAIRKQPVKRADHDAVTVNLAA